MRPESPKITNTQHPLCVCNGAESLIPFPSLAQEFTQPPDEPDRKSIQLEEQNSTSPFQHKKKALPARLLLSLCCVQTGQSAEFCLRQPSLGMRDSLRLHLETIFPPSLLPLSFPAACLGSPVQHHKQLHKHGAGTTPVPRAGESWGCCQGKKVFATGAN